MLKERASGMYRLSAFYFARTASDVPMEVAVPSIFIIIIYVMAGLRPTAWAFFANWSAVVLTMLVAQSFGLLIGALVMVPKTAQTITAVVMLTMMLVGGFYVTNIPVWIAWLKVCVCVGGGGGSEAGVCAGRALTDPLPPTLPQYASFVYYGYHLLLKVGRVAVVVAEGVGGAATPAPHTPRPLPPTPDRVQGRHPVQLRRRVPARPRQQPRVQAGAAGRFCRACTPLGEHRALAVGGAGADRVAGRVSVARVCRAARQDAQPDVRRETGGGGGLCGEVSTGWRRARARTALRLKGWRGRR